MPRLLLPSKTILVTGGNGFLGWHVLDTLQRRGCQNLVAPSRREYDLIDPRTIQILFEKTKPNVVFHLAAAVGGIGLNQREPARLLYENSIMGLGLLEAARRHDVEKVIVVGTTCSYPKSAPLPFREDDLWNGYPEPVTGPYGIAKRLVQLQGQLYRQQYGLNTVFLIPTNLYWPRDNFIESTSHVVPAIIKKTFDAKDNGQHQITLWGDGTATREFLYVEDAAEMIVSAAESCDSSEPINLGTGIETPIRDIAALICQLADYSGEIVWDASKPNGQQRRVLDLGRAETFGLANSTRSLSAGLKLTVEWYRTQAPNTAKRALVQTPS